MSIENDYQPLPAREVPTDLLCCSPEELTGWLAGRGVAAYRAKQILKWIYHRQCNDFGDMTDLSKSLRQILQDRFTIPSLELTREQQARDGTRKFLFRLADGNHIETVLIAERNHATLCISSQVGCALGCRFCRTARGGLVRNLTQGEILAQIRDVRQRSAGQAPLTNLVLMGMGEPLANFRRVVGSLAIVTNSDWGLAFAPRRVTLSTAGVVPRIRELGRASPVNLAISLNAVDNATRSALMPINDIYPLEKLLQACRAYPLRPNRRITFEYILIKDVNDSPGAARKLAKLLRPIRAKINLIPYNPHPGSEFSRPAADTIADFQKILLDRHYPAMIRHSKGTDIAAACGQLRARTEDGV